MLRILIVLFWLGLLVGTFLAHSVVANWSVTLSGLYFLGRWWRGRQHAARHGALSPQRLVPASVVDAAHSQPAPTTGGQPVVRKTRSRWTAGSVRAHRSWC
jgi:hypothetical protein